MIDPRAVEPRQESKSEDEAAAHKASRAHRQAMIFFITIIVGMVAISAAIMVRGWIMGYEEGLFHGGNRMGVINALPFGTGLGAMAMPVFGHFAGNSIGDTLAMLIGFLITSIFMVAVIAVVF